MNPVNLNDKGDEPDEKGSSGTEIGREVSLKSSLRCKGFSRRNREVRLFGDLMTVSGTN